MTKFFVIRGTGINIRYKNHTLYKKMFLVLISNLREVNNFSFKWLFCTDTKSRRNLFTVSVFIFSVKYFESGTQGKLIHCIKSHFGKYLAKRTGKQFLDFEDVGKIHSSLS